MLPILGPFVTVLVAVVAAGAVCAWWIANRKRIAAETIGRAETEAARIVKDAERDAETRRKESLLEAKEKAHVLDGRQPVGDRDRGPARHQHAQGVANDQFGLGVDARRRLVQNQDTGVERQRPGKRKQLPLSD